MSIKEVVHFICDNAGCEKLPCMTESQAISHLERHAFQDKDEHRQWVKLEDYYWAEARE